jgi:hypothetical protein
MSLFSNAAKVYGVDVYVSGSWKSAGREFATLREAVDYGADKWGGHFHVWHNGDCVHDSRPGQPEPANVETDE